MGISYPTGAEVRAWSGAIASASFKANCDFTQTVATVAIQVSLNSDMSSPIYTSAYAPPTLTTGARLSYKTGAWTVTGLSPSTTYYWRVLYSPAASQGGIIRSVKTAPSGAAAYSFAFGSCSNTLNIVGGQLGQSNSTTFRAIAADAPLFLLNLGDTPYSEVSTTDYLCRDYWRVWRDCLDVSSMCKTVPIAYIPSDHDYGTNDISLDTLNAATIMAQARQCYAETIPAYTMPLSGLLTQSFDIGATRFLLLDQYAASTYSGNICLGSSQLAWLQSAMNQAVTDGITWLFVCHARTWLGGTNKGFTDSFPAERKQIVDMAESCMIPVCMLGGDAHACAFDDGTNNASPSTSGFANFPHLLGSAFHQTPAASSGPYSWNGSSNQYASVSQMYQLVTLTADNKNWTAVIKGDTINDTTFAPTTIGTVSTSDVTRAVSFNNTTPSVAHNAVLTVDLNVTWFGAASVTWAGNGQGGTIQLKPNSKRTSFTVNAPSSAGSFTITLSSPSGCTISGTNPITVTVT